MRIERWAVRVSLGVVILLGMANARAAISVEFTKIVDTNTVAPGSAQTFISFDGGTQNRRGDGFENREFAMNNGNVAFFARTSSREGVYIGNGSDLSRLADTTTSIPGTTKTFGWFAANVAISGNLVLFRGNENRFGGARGVFFNDPSGLTAFVRNNDTFPGSSTRIFTSTPYGLSPDFATIYARGQCCGPNGYLTRAQGILRWVVKEDETPHPKGGVFSSVGAIGTMQAGNTLFFEGGNGSVRGVYAATVESALTPTGQPTISVEIETVADSSTSRPDGMGDFDLVNTPSAISSDGNVVVFAVRDPVMGGYQYVKKTGETFSVVAGEQTLDPDDPTSTLSFDIRTNPNYHQVAVGSNFIAFLARGVNGVGLYAEVDDRIHRVVGPGDDINEKTVSALVDLSRKGADGDSVAFTVKFDGGVVALYKARISADDDPGDSEGNGVSRFFAVNNTGSESFLVNLGLEGAAGVTVGPTGFENILGMAFNSNNGQIYGIHQPAGAEALVVIDKLTGNATEIAPVTVSGTALTYDPLRDKLLAVDGASLFEIDPATGAEMRIGPVGFLDLDGLTFDPVNDRLFAVGAGKLISVDRQSGEGTLIGSLGINAIQGLTYDNAASVLIGVDAVEQRLYEIDPSTANAKQIASVQFPNIQAIEIVPSRQVATKRVPLQWRPFLLLLLGLFGWIGAKRLVIP